MNLSNAKHLLMTRLEPFARTTKRLLILPVFELLGWVPLTLRGLAVCITVSAFVHHYWKSDRIILVGGLTLLGISAVCMLSTLITALCFYFRSEKVGSKEHQCEVGCPYRTGFFLGFCGWNPLARFDLSWEKPLHVSARWVPVGFGSCEEEITPVSRGMADSLTRRIVISDVLGLSRCIVRRRFNHAILIRPKLGAAAHVNIRHATFTHEQTPDPDGKPEGELIETRRYTAGDPLKLVMWKVYARTGQLLVRSAERTATVAQRGFAYMVAGEGDEATASTVQAMLATDQFGDRFLFGADGCAQDAQGREDALVQLIRSSQGKDQSAQGLSNFLARAATCRMSTGVLFLPQKPGQWLNRVVDALTKFDGSIQVIIGTDEYDNTPSDKSHWLRRFLFRSTESADGAHGLTAIRTQLEARGVSVTVVKASVRSA